MWCLPIALAGFVIIFVVAFFNHSTPFVGPGQAGCLHYPPPARPGLLCLGHAQRDVPPDAVVVFPFRADIGFRQVRNIGFLDDGDTLVEPFVVQLLGQRVEHFCYPYGSHDIRAVEGAAEAGYVTGTTCLRAIATPEDDLLSLPRKPVSQGNTAFGVLWKLLTKNTPRSAPIRRGKHPETTLQDRRIGEHGMGPSSAGA